jgi:hypothetical protein
MMVTNFVFRNFFAGFKINEKRDLKLFYLKKYSSNYYRLIYLLREMGAVDLYELVIYDASSGYKILKSVEITA